ncbi:MAG: leucine-rich repeat domain-containing protein [Bacteroidales bacterium]
MIKSFKIPILIFIFGISFCSLSFGQFKTDGNGTILEYEGSPSENLVIPPKINDEIITTIGSEAFDFKYVKSVHIPEGIVTIEPSAFRYCNIRKITFSEGLEVIGENAFSHTQLTEIIIPKSIISIGNNAFAYSPICKITNNSNLNLTKAMFYRCPIGQCKKGIIYNLNEDVSIDSTSITHYNGYAKSITIPEHVIRIENEAFEENNLLEVILPNSITSIGRAAFYENKLTKILLPLQITVIPEMAFMNNKLKSVEIPKGVTEIGDRAFELNKIENLSISETVRKINRKAFFINIVRTLFIPKNVEHVGESAFTQNNIEELTLYVGTKVNKWAFTYNKINTLTIMEINGQAYEFPFLTFHEYTFLGWYDNEQLEGNPITEIKAGNNYVNKTFWAKWGKKQN